MIISRACLAATLLVAACGGSSKRGAATTPAPVAETHPRQDDADDEDTSDGVEIQGGHGTLEPGEIQPVISGASDALSSCFTDNTARLPYVGGHVELKFKVAVDGAVKSVQVASSDLGAWPVEKCMLGVARALQFPKPHGGDAELTIPIDFPARSAAMALGEDKAQAELSPKLSALAECDQTAGDPSEVQVTVYVGVKGAVMSAGFATAAEQPFSDAWADCALAKVMSWKLADPRGKVVKAQGGYASR